MLAIAGQPAQPNYLTFFKGNHGFPSNFFYLPGNAGHSAAGSFINI